jgi:hypothetical protein
MTSAVQEADAARRDGPPDGPRLEGAVDPVQGVAAVLVKVEGTGPQRVLGSSRHASRPPAGPPVPGQHLRRWRPARPLRLARDGRRAAPGEPVAADADAVAHGFPALHHEKEEPGIGINDDGPGPLARRVRHDLAVVLIRDPVEVDGGDTERLRRGGDEQPPAHPGVRRRDLRSGRDAPAQEGRAGTGEKHAATDQDRTSGQNYCRACIERSSFEDVLTPLAHEGARRGQGRPWGIRRSPAPVPQVGRRKYATLARNLHPQARPPAVLQGRVHTPRIKRMPRRPWGSP